MVVLETFRGGQYFGYKELLDEGLPICIDTSHMKHVEALDLVERYHNKIVHVHLSEAMGGLTHQPAGKASLELLTRLTELGWDGSVCFEYLDGYAEEMRKDLKAFRSLFG
jgi:sugar phosphate isomerase/epimerase